MRARVRVRALASHAPQNVSTAWHRLATLARKQPAAAPASAAQLAPLAALTLEWVGRLDARSCSNVLWALAVLSARAPAPAPDLLRPLLRASAEQAGRDSGYTPAAASATAWAAASLLADAPDDCAALVEAMLAESAAALPRCSAQSVANLLWAAATAAQLVPFSAAAPAAAQAAARLLLPAADARAFKPIELSCAAWALAELRYDPGPQAMSALDGSLAQLLGAEPALASVSAQSLVNIVWAFAVLNHSPRQTLELLRSSHLAAAAAAAALQASDVHLLLWSLAVMDQGEHIRSPIFAAAWAAASQVDGAACHPSHLAGLFQATLMEEADATARRLPPAQRPPPLPPPLMAAAEASWRAVVCQTRTSDLHEAIAATVAQLGLPTPLWIEKLTSDRLFSIDIALHFPPPGAAAPVEAAEPPPLASQGTLAEGPGGASGGMWVALEVDGPSHYTRNTQAPMGRSTYRNRLLASRGWRVVVLPFYRWNEMKTAEDRRVRRGAARPGFFF